jgi:ABC-type transport system involved in multi-copper enzyme maturation permease subunit
MYALIKREIQDHIVYFIGAAVFSAVFIIMSISLIHQYNPKEPPVFSIGLGVPAATIVIFGICAMGATQMYLDRTRKISALLSTLAVSRNQILLARIITGILAILILFVPLTISAGILLRIFTPPIPMFSGIVFEISFVVFLMAFACYCIGLQTGWNSSALTPSLGALFLTCILVPLILIKGFGVHIVVILVLFIVASLIRTWHTFMTTSL